MSWIYKKKGWAIFFSIILVIAIIYHIYAVKERRYWESEIKCKVSECQNVRTYGDYCAEHRCNYHECQNLRMEGSIFCTEHGYCAYEGCGKLLSYLETKYCKEHQKIVDQERKKEIQESIAKAEKEAEIRESAKRYRERQARKKIKSSPKKKAVKSYDNGYDDVYNGDYDSKRYKTNSEYANGVDDAMDEFGDDW